MANRVTPKTDCAKKSPTYFAYLGIGEIQTVAPARKGSAELIDSGHSERGNQRSERTAVGLAKLNDLSPIVLGSMN